MGITLCSLLHLKGYRLEGVYRAYLRCATIDKVGAPKYVIGGGRVTGDLTLLVDTSDMLTLSLAGDRLEILWYGPLHDEGGVAGAEAHVRKQMLRYARQGKELRAMAAVERLSPHRLFVGMSHAIEANIHFMDALQVELRRGDRDLFQWKE